MKKINTVLIISPFLARMFYMMHWITTTDTQRLRQWQRIFSTDTLPVLSNRARFVTGEDGHSRPVYDLALAQLHTGQLQRLAADIARRTMQSYDTVWRDIQARPSYPIPAANCRVVVLENPPEETADASARPSLFMRARQWYGRLAVAG